MMTAGARQRGRGRRRPFGTVARKLFPLVLIVPVTVMFGMVWQSVGDQATSAQLERNGVKYIQALVPLEIALTNAESDAVKGGTAREAQLTRAVEAVAVVDKELGGQLRTQDRWTGLRTKIESLPTRGTGAAIITAYGGADDLLLALTDKVRNNSTLIRDPEADTYYLEDGAAQELPEGIAAAAHYTDLLVTTAGLAQADQAKALVEISSAHSDLASNAQDLSDDVRLAVEGTDTRNLGSELLTKLDRFNRAIDNLAPLMAPLSSGKGSIDAAKVVRARDETQAAASDLSTALLSQIDTALHSRLTSLTERRLLAIGALVVSVLLAFTPAGLALAARRRRGTAAPEQDQPPTLPQVPVQPATVPANQMPANQMPANHVPPNQWPMEPVPAQWPDSRPHTGSDPEYARWERFGAPQ